MNTLSQIEKAKIASQNLPLIEERDRNRVLRSLANRLRKEVEPLLEANGRDLTSIAQEDPMYDRLLLTRERIDGLAHDIESVIALPSPIGNILSSRVLENGLRLQKVATPLGVVAVIYESRPNVTIDVFVLCFKTGNAAVLKGGKEAHNSNQFLVGLIHQILHEEGIDPHLLYLLPPNRAETTVLLHATGLVDVCIPRGGQSLIDFVRENAKIPVIETGAGIVHTYFDESGDLKKGVAIIENAKTRRVAVCNALDCLIIHEARLKDVAELIYPLARHKVEIFADLESYQSLASHYPQGLLHRARPEDFGREFLSYKLAVKTVSTIESAVDHIMHYTSGHSEAIIAEDEGAIDYFFSRVDAAALYANASTAFTDGGQFGLGAEIGISTQKLHARGPMGLEALTSYKWVVRGAGQIRQ